MIELKRPAHTGFVPRPVQWGQPSPQELEVIAKLFVDDIAGYLLKKVDAQPQKLIGYYRIKGKENAFVKLLRSNNAESNLESEVIARWLLTQGIRVNPVRLGFPKLLDQYDAHIFVYDYIESKFFDITPAHLLLIGQALGHMHSVLRKYPERKRVKRRGRLKNKVLRNQLYRIQQGEWRCEVNDAVTEILNSTLLTDLDLLEENAQMIHGDMNYGNVLLDTETDTPVFIDFEDSASSWLSPLYDIAFVIQRFILVHEVKIPSLFLDSFIEGYRSSCRIRPSYRQDALFIIYKLISIRALLLLSLLNASDQVLYQDEYDKFVWLHENAWENAALINQTYKALFT